LESFGEHRWLLWAVASAVLACTEMLSGEFTLLMLAAGAGALLLTVLRPTLLRRVREAPGYRSALDKLVGSDGVATSDITDGHGQVKVDGEEWSARALEPGSTIAAGEKIEVYEIDGATLVVYPVFRSLSS